jgi:hypothetical protein
VDVHSHAAQWLYGLVAGRPVEIVLIDAAIRAILPCLKIRAVREIRPIADLLVDAIELHLSRVETSHDEAKRPE